MSPDFLPAHTQGTNGLHRLDEGCGVAGRELFWAKASCGTLQRVYLAGMPAHPPTQPGLSLHRAEDRVRVLVILGHEM